MENSSTSSLSTGVVDGRVQGRSWHLDGGVKSARRYGRGAVQRVRPRIGPLGPMVLN